MPESMEFEVVIVGAGPAGLSAAIRLRQLSPEMRVCVIEKGSEVGAHLLSGAVIETRALDELIPDWKNRAAPLQTPVSEDRFLFLTKNNSWQVPNWLLPKQLQNHGNYVGSLANLCRWLAEQASALGVEIYPGFAAAKIIFDDQNKVCGVVTGEMGLNKDGSHKPDYSEGMELRAKCTLFAEGCRGYLSEQLIKHYNLRNGIDPQTYGLGIKEIWEVKPELHQPGLVQHTAGWPLTNDIYGGSFIYHMGNHQVSVGLVVGLDYRNTFLDPYQEMQRFKLHPDIRPLFAGAKRIAYGAKALNEGGLQSIPKLAFPGGMLIGCAAGFLDVAKIKGTHNAMKSGMLAAEAIVSGDVENYPASIRQSWIYQELHQSRNFRPYFRYGLKLGTLLAGIDLKILRGKTPWTLHYQHCDRYDTQKSDQCIRIQYPRPDGIITFDRMNSVFLSNIKYDENQPVHLHLRNPAKSIDISYREYDSPEQRYCPAGVYEILFAGDGNPRLQINAANCIHCKTCDIKDPADNIIWIVPEGGSGPNYPNM